MGIRRSGRTFAALVAAVVATNNGTKEVNFVVWHSPMIEQIRRMLREDMHISTRELDKLHIITYDRYLCCAEYAYNHRRHNPTVNVFDHYVIEELDYARTGRRQPDTIKVVLECNGWEREEVISTDHWGRGHYRMAMAEPLSAMAYSRGEYPCDATTSVKVVNFHRTNRTNKDGLMIFAHEG